MRKSAQLVGSHSTGAIEFGVKKDAEEYLSAFSFKKHITAAALYDQNGKLFATYAATNAGPMTFPKNPEADGARFEPGRLIVFQKLYQDGDFAGTIYAQSDLQEQTDRFERYACIIGLFMFASLLVTLFLSSRMQRVISRPIFQLAQTARAVTAEKGNVADE